MARAAKNSHVVFQVSVLRYKTGSCVLCRVSSKLHQMSNYGRITDSGNSYVPMHSRAIKNESFTHKNINSVHVTSKPTNISIASNNNRLKQS